MYSSSLMYAIVQQNIESIHVKHPFLHSKNTWEEYTMYFMCVFVGIPAYNKGLSIYNTNWKQ